MSAIDNIKNKDTLLIVDPVMGDNGNAYSGFSVSYPSYMLRLCQKADIITPNLTEAALLAGMPYRDGICEEEYICELLKRLYELTKAKVVLTGVSFDKKRIGAAIYDDGEIYYTFAEKHSNERSGQKNKPDPAKSHKQNALK